MMFAALQLNTQDDLAKNLERVEALAGEAAARGAKAILLPENFAFFGAEEERARVAEELSGGGPILTRLRAIATRWSVHVLAGGMPERAADERRPYNTLVHVTPSGDVAEVYRKVHLFDVELGDGARYRESGSTTPGAEPVVADVAGYKVGLSICYDLRFPELYRALSSRGAEILVVPAAFTLATGKDHWLVLLRARAIEAQAYVVAAAQWGKHPRGRVTYGKSCIIDPWGDVIAQASEGEGFVVAPIDRGYLARVRASLPALTHRKLG